MSVREDLKAYLDGELSPVRMQEVREAVEADPELARELEDLRSLSAAIRRTEPAYAVVGMEATLARLERKRTSGLRWLGLPLALAGAAVLLAVVFRPGGDRAADEVAMKAPETKTTVAQGSAVPLATPPAGKSEFRAADTAAKVPSEEKSKSQGAFAPLRDIQSDGLAASPKESGKGTKRSLFVAQPTERTPARNRAAKPKVATRLQAADKSPLQWDAKNAPMAQTIAPPAALNVPSPQMVAGKLAQNESKGGEPKPLVLEVESAPETEAKLRLTMVPFEGRIERDKQLLKPSPTQEWRFVVDVPEAKADEALAAIKALAPRPPAALDATTVNALSSAKTVQPQSAGIPAAAKSSAKESAPPAFRDASASRDLQQNRSPGGPGGSAGNGPIGGAPGKGSTGKASTGGVAVAGRLTPAGAGGFGGGRLARTVERGDAKAQVPTRKIVIVIRQKRAPTKKVNPGNLEP